MILLTAIGIALVAAMLYSKKCPCCGSRDTQRIKSGFATIRDWLCCNCGKLFDSLPFK